MGFFGEAGVVEGFVDHVEHTLRVGGEDCVALGSDWDGGIVPVEGLGDVTGLPRITRALLDRGHSEGFIRKALGEVLPGLPVESIRPSPIDGVSEVQLGSRIFYISNDGKYMLQGNLIDMKTNLRMGCTILKYYMDMEKNDLHKALARYNGSAGSKVYSNKVLKALQYRWYKS